MAEFMSYVFLMGLVLCVLDALSNVWCWFGMILWKQGNG